jgi:hypothetical protein
MTSFQCHLVVLAYAAVSAVDLVVYCMIGLKLMNCDCNISFIWVALIANGWERLMVYIGSPCFYFSSEGSTGPIDLQILEDRKGIPKSI